jgi:hypothetical protein
VKRAKKKLSPSLTRNAKAVEQMRQFMRRSMRTSAPISGIDIKARINEGRAGYQLSDLLTQSDPAAPPPADMAEWNNLGDVGREKLAGD